VTDPVTVVVCPTSSTDEDRTRVGAARAGLTVNTEEEVITACGVALSFTVKQ
jgi:hypothetical protein